MNAKYGWRGTSGARSAAADRFAQRRQRGERRNSGGNPPDEDRRSGTERRITERRTEHPGEFSREAAVVILRSLNDPRQTKLLRAGKLSCPQCTGYLRLKAPTRWAGAPTVWEIRCNECPRLLVHKTAN